MSCCRLTSSITFNLLQVTPPPPVLQKVHNPSLSDLVTLYYPSMELMRAGGSLTALWNPFSFLGVPALANAQNGTLFPFSWLFKVLAPSRAYLAIALAKMWFCGLFAFLFFRKAGFQASSAVLGSIGFMLCGHMIVWFGYPTSLPLTVWPFLMWALERFLVHSRLRDLAWLAIGFGLLFIGGQPQTGFLISASTALYLAVRSRERPGRIARVWIGFVVAALLGLCLAAPQILPFLEYLQVSSASAMRGTMGHYGWKHYPWYTLISWMMPRFFGDVRDGNFWGFSSLLGEAVYLGAAPLIFAIMGLFSFKKGGNFHKGALAVFLFGCLGLYIRPLAGLYLYVPLLSGIDNNKLVSMVAFGLIAFSVIGFEAILSESADYRKLMFKYAGIALVWLAFIAFGCYYFRDAIQTLQLTSVELREGAWVVAFLLAGGGILWLLKSARLSPRAAAGVILLVMLCDLFRIWFNYLPTCPENYLLPKSESVEFLQKNAGNSRILGMGEMLPPEISTLYRLQDMRGYDGMTPYSYYNFLGKVDPGIHNLLSKLQAWRPPAGKWTLSTLFFASYAVYLDSTDPKVKSDLSRIDYWSNGISSIQRPSLLSMSGVRYILSSKGASIPEGCGFKMVHQSDADVWENPNVLPRAYVVTGAVAAGSSEAALELISGKDFAFDKTAVITGREQDVTTAGSAGNSGDGKLVPAEIVAYGAERVQVRAVAPRDGWLILSDLFYPGWRATCDGQPVEIVPGNYLFRAVKIKAGTHTVDYNYQPASFRTGWILSLMAGITIIWMLIWNRLWDRSLNSADSCG